MLCSVCYATCLWVYEYIDIGCAKTVNGDGACQVWSLPVIGSGVVKGGQEGLDLGTKGENGLCVAHIGHIGRERVYKGEGEGVDLVNNTIGPSQGEVL